MDVKRYPFSKNSQVADKDAAVFRSYMMKLISKKVAISRISKNNDYPMTEEQFDYYVRALGWR